jgi:hypothetical protein
VEDQPVVGRGAFVFWDVLLEFGLDCKWSLAVREPEPVRYAEDVGVHGYDGLVVND